jgi:hypothetical protein
MIGITAYTISLEENAVKARWRFNVAVFGH